MYIWILSAFLFFMSWTALRADAGEILRVVATQSNFADLVEEIGGDDVSVHAVASPKFNVHFIEPKPSDVLKLKRADLFVHGGLDLESWRGPLVDAAGNIFVRPGASGELDISRGVRLLEAPSGALSRSAGDIHIYGNPHYSLDPGNAGIMASSVALKLGELRPERAGEYQKRLNQFRERLDGRVRHWKKVSRAVSGKEAIAYHNAWPYLAEFMGIGVNKFLEPKPGIPPTPRQLRALESYMKERAVRTIVQSTYYGKGSADTLAKRTNAQVVLLCQNVGEISECADYIALMDYNVTRLVQALSGENI